MKLAARAGALHADAPGIGGFLKGRHEFLTADSRRAAASEEALFELAIRLDPKFALPQSGDGLYILTAAMMGHAPTGVMPRVREAAREALEMNPSLPEAQAALGIVAALRLRLERSRTAIRGSRSRKRPLPVSYSL